jgi:hypothetical protein
MSCERYHDALTDLAAGGSATAEVEAHLAACEPCRGELDALRRALAIAETEMARLVRAEPSPGLIARIRTAVAEPTAARTGHFGWIWPAMAASVVLLVAVAAWMIRTPAPARVAVENRPAAAPRASRPAEEGNRTSEAPETTAPSPREQVRVPVRGGAEAAILRHGHRPARAVPAAPEVLVPPGEAEALVRFAAIVHRDRQAPAAFLEAGRPSADLAEPAELVIKPLEIVPLDPAETPGT